MNNSIITILGDSLALHRVDEGIEIFDTYELLLKDRLGNEFHILNKSRRGNTSSNQVGKQYLYDEVLYTRASYVIIHLGICDCAPRIIGKKEFFILNNFIPNKIKAYYIKFKSNNRRFFTKYFPKVHVNKEQFETNMSLLISTILKTEEIKKIILIGICDTNKENKYKSCNFELNIEIYNNILNQFKDYEKIDFIDMYNLSKKMNLMNEDGIHISKFGHKVIANKIYEIISTILK